MKRCRVSRAHAAKANVEITAKTRKAIEARIVIRCPALGLTRVLDLAAACFVVTARGMPATSAATAEATASASVMIARHGRLRDFGVATAQRYREARWSRAGPARHRHTKLKVHQRLADRQHWPALHACDDTRGRCVPGHQRRGDA